MKAVVVGADRCVCPDIKNKYPETGEHIGSPLHRMVQWFKTMTTNEYIRGINEHEWELFNGKLWQRNYYEHQVEKLIDNRRGFGFFSETRMPYYIENNDV